MSKCKHNPLSPSLDLTWEHKNECEQGRGLPSYCRWQHRVTPLLIFFPSWLSFLTLLQALVLDFLLSSLAASPVYRQTALAVIQQQFLHLVTLQLLGATSPADCFEAIFYHLKSVAIFWDISSLGKTGRRCRSVSFPFLHPVITQYNMLIIKCSHSFWPMWTAAW